MKLKVYKDGSKLVFGPEPVMGDEVPKGNWMLKYDSQRQFFFLEESKPFTYPQKVYGDVLEDVKFYADAYRTTDKNLGIILNGEKGSGKTLLSTLLCQELGLPVIMITSGFRGTEFVKFMDDIPNPVVVMIDEFDKTYAIDYDDPDTGQRVSGQTDLLRIMDAGNSNRKLFILTSNRLALSEFMINRPSRIKYSQTFDKLSDEVVEDLLDDRLSKELVHFKNDFFEVINVYGSFNLDSLLVLVDEVNRLKISPKKAIRRMNMEPETINYNVKLVENGQEHDWPQWTSDFDLLGDGTVPQLAFREEGCEPSPKNGGRKGFFRVVEREKIKNFDVAMRKNGFTLTHKIEKYSLLFERSKPVSYSGYDL